MNDFESELKKRFAVLRADDETSAPSFAVVRDRATVDQSIGTRRQRLWMIPLLAAAVVAAVWVTSRARGERARREAWLRDSSMNAFRWTMPTDGLLESARQTLHTPAISASVLDAAAVPIPGTPFKGD